MADEDNFFSRWSRRKVQKQAGEPVPEAPVGSAPVAPVAPAATVVGPKPAQAVPPGAVASPAPGTVSTGAVGAQDQPPATAQEKAPPPTLSDVAELTKDSDFSRFVGKDVSPDVRNAAMKKLFADPHFNVMDGLDIYIDDYSIPSPMSKDFARTLASAKFMKLFDEPEKTDDPEKSGEADRSRPATAAASAEPAVPEQGNAAESLPDPAPKAAHEAIPKTARSGDAEPPPSTPSPVAP